VEKAAKSKDTEATGKIVGIGKVLLDFYALQCLRTVTSEFYTIYDEINLITFHGNTSLMVFYNFCCLMDSYPDLGGQK
jgi:hypothetical protein